MDDHAARPVTLMGKPLAAPLNKKAVIIPGPITTRIPQILFPMRNYEDGGNIQSRAFI